MTLDIGHSLATTRLGAAVYDAVKQIPAFCVSLVPAATTKSSGHFGKGRCRPSLQVVLGSDRQPSEERFRSPWHHEFPAQLRSLDGIVFWTPLIEVTAEMGPVEIAVGSQREGLIPVREERGGDRSGAYA